MKKAALICALLILTNICFSWQVKLMRTISIDERDLLIPSVFAVLEDGKDTCFYVNDVRLRIAVIDLRSMKIEFIGKEPADFRALSMNKKTSDALMDPRSGISVEDILTKHSFVNGVFADKDMVGVLYVNRDKTINHELLRSSPKNYGEKSICCPVSGSRVGKPP